MGAEHRRPDVVALDPDSVEGRIVARRMTRNLIAIRASIAARKAKIDAPEENRRSQPPAPDERTNDGPADGDRPR